MNHLPWEGSYNIRDLGGYTTANGQRLRSHALLRADDLDRLTVNGQQALLAYGVRTVIDVRSSREATTWPHAFTQHPTVAYHNLPIGEIVETVPEVQVETATMIDWNCLVLKYEQAQIATILRRLAQAEPGGVLIHCHAGKDRTGLVIALILALVGVAAEQIVADYAASTHYLQPLFAQWLQAVADDPVKHAQLAHVLSATPETMQALLADVETDYGGITAYVQRCGLTADEIGLICQRLYTDA